MSLRGQTVLRSVAGPASPCNAGLGRAPPHAQAPQMEMMICARAQPNAVAAPYSTDCRRGNGVGLTAVATAAAVELPPSPTGHVQQLVSEDAPPPTRRGVARHVRPATAGRPCSGPRGGEAPPRAPPSGSAGSALPFPGLAGRSTPPAPCGPTAYAPAAGPPRRSAPRGSDEAAARGTLLARAAVWGYVGFAPSGCHRLEGFLGRNSLQPMTFRRCSHSPLHLFCRIQVHEGRRACGDDGDPGVIEGHPEAVPQHP